MRVSLHAELFVSKEGRAYRSGPGWTLHKESKMIMCMSEQCKGKVMSKLLWIEGIGNHSVYMNSSV